MNALNYPKEILSLIEALKQLPGIGQRGAERMALWVLENKGIKSPAISLAIDQALNVTSFCPQCGFFSRNEELCTACLDDQRQGNLICVVEQASDVLPIERSGAYQGLYHCLGGKLSPLDDINPEDLHISELIDRVKATPDCEIILALSSDVEGEATASYLHQILTNTSCKLSRLAQGLPAGAGLSHADTLTVMKALQGRTTLP